VNALSVADVEFALVVWLDRRMALRHVGLRSSSRARRRVDRW
jgi:hypothetical protein